MATAVISASEACHYAQMIVPALPLETATITLLAAFMILTIIGITESAFVAIFIFLLHLFTLALLLGVGILFFFAGVAAWAGGYLGTFVMQKKMRPAAVRKFLGCMLLLLAVRMIQKMLL